MDVRRRRLATGREVRTRNNKVAAADGLAESGGWGVDLCELCLENRAFLLKFKKLKFIRFFIFKYK